MSERDAMGDREFWLEIRRALLYAVKAIEKRYLPERDGKQAHKR